MAKKEKLDLTFPQIMQKLAQAGVSESKSLKADRDAFSEIAEIEERVRMILGIINSKERKATNMLFFVMYDIESNKVRTLVAKYLIKLGCTRVQRSIFLADLSNEKYEQIRSELTEVQALYENKDSILVVPISTDYLQAMRIIGKSIDVDIILKTRNTLFF